MKRVLVIAPYTYLPYFSGGQKTIAHFLEFLSAETELTVISTRSNEASNIKGYRLLRWLPNPFWRYLDFRLYFRIGRLIKHSPFDCIIWIHPYYYWLARLIQQKHTAYTIIQSHNIEYQRFRSTGKWWWPILRTYEGKCLKQADFNYFITPNDREEAIQEWGLSPERTDVLPMGIRQQQNPSDRSICQQIIRERHDIPENTRILLFNGLLNYPPNQQALDHLLQEINPRLLKRTDLKYRLIICGKNLPAAYHGLSDHLDQNVLFAGFVKDIETYFKGADLFLNPILSGGGIKTKMVESIALGTTVISTETGAAGIDRKVCGEKLQVAPDQDWNRFIDLIIEQAGKHIPTPQAYYDQYHWANIVKKIPKLLADQTTR